MHRLLQRIAPLRAVPLHLVLHHSIERLPRDPPRGHLPCSETAQSGAHPAPSARGGPARREHRRLPRSDPSAGRAGTGRDRTGRPGSARPAPRPAPPQPALPSPRRRPAALPQPPHRPGMSQQPPRHAALPSLPPSFLTRARRRRSANAARLRDGAELTVKVRAGGGQRGRGRGAGERPAGSCARCGAARISPSVRLRRVLDPMRERSGSMAAACACAVGAPGSSFAPHFFARERLP